MCKKTLCAVLALIAALSLFGQTSGQSPAQIRSPADLDGEIAALASWIKQFPGLAGKKLEVSAVSFGGQEAPLGTYWKHALIGALAGGNVTVLEPGSVRGDYQLTGEILDLGQTVRIFTRLAERGTSAVLASWTSDLEKSPFLETLLVVSSGGSSPVARDTYEDDSQDAPVEVINGEAIARTIHRDDTDWFVIRPSEDLMVMMETRGSTDTIMELYEGSTRLGQDDDSGEGENARIGCQLKGGKTYIAKVAGYSSGDTGRYEFLVRSAELPDKDREPNNTRETASAVTADTDIEGYITSGSDRDWYHFTLSGAGSVSFFTQGRTDTVLELYNAGGRKLAGDDDGGNGGNDRIIRNLEPGDYFLLVRGYGRETAGEYLLRIQVRQIPERDSYESDNSRQEAKKINLGEVQRRNFSGGDDQDWASFTVTSAGYYSIRARGEKDINLDTLLELYNNGGSLIAEDDDGGGSYSSLMRQRLTPGTYYIKVSCLDDYPEDYYLLSVERE